jgi:hypothetical protein
VLTFVKQTSPQLAEGGIPAETISRGVTDLRARLCDRYAFR